jgi:uncharacterized protein YijF (DUF1287 family)
VAYTTTATAIFIAAVILIAAVVVLYRRRRARRAAARDQRPIGVALNDAQPGEIVSVRLDCDFRHVNVIGETADKIWPEKK